MANRNLLPEVTRNQAWNPLREMSRMQRRMDRIFDELMPSVSLGREVIRPGLDEIEFTPPCDIQETSTHYLLTFDIPGIAKEDVRIELREGTLVVSGERKEDREHREAALRTQERYYGAFERVFTLPQAAEAEKIEANYENGVLQVAVQKSVAASPKSIPIKSEKGGIFSRLLAHEKKGEKAA